MTSDRKKPGVAFWASVVVVVVLVYVGSFGPACWIASRTHTDDGAFFSLAYRPMWWAMRRDVPLIGETLTVYAGLAMGHELRIPKVGPSDNSQSLQRRD
jgi:hypothetical protein